jgi:hypothetical protein
MTTSLRRSGARTQPAASLLAGLALTALTAAGLAGCGSDDGTDTATDPASTSSTPSPSEDTSTPTPSDTLTPEPGTMSGDTIDVGGSAGITSATLLHGTDVGGSSSTLAFALDSDQAKADFAAQFDGGTGAGFADTISSAADSEAQASPGSTPYAAIVAVGCEPPRSVTIDAGEAGFEVVARMPKSTVQCFAPMTYVVVFAAPDA